MLSLRIVFDIQNVVQTRGTLPPKQQLYVSDIQRYNQLKSGRIRITKEV